MPAGGTALNSSFQGEGKEEILDDYRMIAGSRLRVKAGGILSTAWLKAFQERLVEDDYSKEVVGALEEDKQGLLTKSSELTLEAAYASQGLLQQRVWW